MRTRRLIKTAEVYVGKGLGAHLTRSHSESTDRALMQDALKKHSA